MLTSLFDNAGLVVSFINTSQTSWNMSASMYANKSRLRIIALKEHMQVIAKGSKLVSKSLTFKHLVNEPSNIDWLD